LTCSSAAQVEVTPWTFDEKRILADVFWNNAPFEVAVIEDNLPRSAEGNTGVVPNDARYNGCKTIVL